MNRMIRTIALVAAFGVLAFDAPALSAQTTFTACRIPDVGAIYMIGVTGAPSACLDASHVEFSWTEGGAAGTGSVTSDAILDGTIQAVDIATDAVTGDAIAPGAVGSTEILDASIQAADLAAAAVLEPGVEFSESIITSIDPTTANLTAGSVTLSHPASGYLVVNATGQIQCSLAQVVNLGITNGGSGDDGWIYQVPATGTSYTMVHKQEVIEVTGAGAATVNFNIQLSGGDNCNYFRAVEIAAVYVPVRY